MRAIFGVLSLVVVLALVGVLAKKQLTTVRSGAPALTQLPAADTGAAVAGADASPSVLTSPSQQLQQYKQSLDAATQPVRPELDPR